MFEELLTKARKQLNKDLAKYKKTGVKSDLIIRLENMGCML